MSAPTSWLWDFGDGSTSTEQNPVHTYESEGAFTVKLTATNSAGSDTETKTDYITTSARLATSIREQDKVRHLSARRTLPSRRNLAVVRDPKVVRILK